MRPYSLHVFPWRLIITPVGDINAHLTTRHASRFCTRLAVAGPDADDRQVQGWRARRARCATKSRSYPLQSLPNIHPLIPASSNSHPIFYHQRRALIIPSALELFIAFLPLHYPSTHTQPICVLQKSSRRCSSRRQRWLRDRRRVLRRRLRRRRDANLMPVEISR
jgi:hypothetical protein